MDQTSLTDIPFDVESYCGEVGKGLSDEQIALMARPKTLTHLQQELMYWHEKLYHLPFQRLIALANKGILPLQLSKCRNDAPICISCQFGQAHKRPWRSKGKRSNPIRKITDNKVGDCVWTDQLISAQQGLIPQMQRAAQLRFPLFFTFPTQYQRSERYNWQRLIQSEASGEKGIFPFLSFRQHFSAFTMQSLEISSSLSRSSWRLSPIRPALCALWRV